MEETETKEKICLRCRYFNRYYVKGYCEFIKTEQGYCAEEEKTVTINETCGQWTKKKYLRNKLRKARVLGVLTKALTDISALHEIYLNVFQETTNGFKD